MPFKLSVPDRTMMDFSFRFLLFSIMKDSWETVCVEYVHATPEAELFNKDGGKGAGRDGIGAAGQAGPSEIQGRVPSFLSGGA